MLRKVGVLFFLVSLSMPAAAGNLPEILTSPSNAVPKCVTPGRLMAFLKLRNPDLDPRYDSIATHYMRQGEKLGVRWDYAFYQMVVETGALSYRRGNRAGDVKASQNNFAGLGASGRGKRGESFKDVETGVRAHLEHLMLYAGQPVAEPVAERTRKVHQWGVLTNWQRGFKRPINFTDLAARWAPGTRSYGGMLESVADRFADLCNKPDPRPELVQEARGLTTKASAPLKAAEAKAPRPSGAELAQRAIEQGKAEGNDNRSALGAQPPPPVSPPPAAPFKVLNTPPAAKTPGANASFKAAAAEKAAITPPPASPKAGAARFGSRTALAPAAAAKSKAPSQPPPPAAASRQCRVWTASYGGQRAVIIRSIADETVNFTVLDVNEGSEAREAAAFISAYAKNGEIAGEFSSQSQALDKAFELCPEG
jgi:hypothetical protein